MTKRYLSQKFTKKQVEKLFTQKGKIQMITAPTGAGKTYFIQQNVIKIAKGDFKPFGASIKKALLLANRSVLVSQIKEDLNINLDKTSFKSSHEEEYVTKYVDILSYQALAKRILEGENFLDRYKLIIADECHYFLNDYWNNTTQLTLNKLIEHSKENTILFFSATTEELKRFMDAIKNIDYNGKELYEEIIDEEQSKDLGFNDRLDIIVTNDNLDSVLEQIPPNEKFVVFVNELMSKERIEELSSKMNKDNRLIGFLYSKWEKAGRGFRTYDEMSQRYEDVLKKEGFYDDEMLGLIANNAIDNGINFKMEDLKHIVLLNQYDFTQIKQFIGRKRHNPDNPNDRTNVYIISHNKEELERLKKSFDKTMEYYEDYEKLSKNDFMEKYKEEVTLHSVFINDYENSYIEGLKTWNKTDYKVKRDNNFPFMITISIKGDIEIHPNYCQIQKVACKLNIIDGVLYQLKYCTMAKFFEVNLNKYYNNVKIVEVDRTKNQKRHSAKEEIPEHLKNIKGKQFDKEKYKQLRELFKNKWEIKDMRNGRVLGDGKFREYINEFGFDIFKTVNKERKTVYIISER